MIREAGGTPSSKERVGREVCSWEAPVFLGGGSHPAGDPVSGGGDVRAKPVSGEAETALGLRVRPRLGLGLWSSLYQTPGRDSGLLCRPCPQPFFPLTETDLPASLPPCGRGDGGTPRKF